MPHRLPVDVGRLHRDMGDALLAEPVAACQLRRVGCRTSRRDGVLSDPLGCARRPRRCPCGHRAPRNAGAIPPHGLPPGSAPLQGDAGEGPTSSKSRKRAPEPADSWRKMGCSQVPGQTTARASRTKRIQQSPSPKPSTVLSGRPPAARIARRLGVKLCGCPAHRLVGSVAV